MGCLCYVRPFTDAKIRKNGSSGDVWSSLLINAVLQLKQVNEMLEK
jgi:hypothetical protein